MSVEKIHIIPSQCFILSSIVYYCDISPFPFTWNSFPGAVRCLDIVAMEAGWWEEVMSADAKGTTCRCVITWCPCWWMVPLCSSSASLSQRPGVEFIQSSESAELLLYWKLEETRVWNSEVERLNKCWIILTPHSDKAKTTTTQQQQKYCICSF